MKKKITKIICVAFVICATNIFAQKWTKISSNVDSLWTTSVNYFNHGDTLVYFGSTEGTGVFAKKRFYVSTNGGKTFQRDYTLLDNVGYNAFYSLPQNNLFLGFKNTPNVGTYAFKTPNKWDTLYFDGSGYGFWCDYTLGKALFQPHGSDDFYLYDIKSKNLQSKEISDKLMARTSLTVGNLLFIGGKGGIYTLTVGTPSSIVKGVSTTNSGAFKGDIVRFFVANNVVYAVASDGTDYLYKTTDNGANWTLIDTKFEYFNTMTTLTSSFTIGTPNGKIYYLNAGTASSNDVYMSTDGGTTASKISDGLPSSGLRISSGRNKLLTKGNKVWYHLLAAKQTDFVTTDTSVAGLYVFENENVDDINIDEFNLKFSVYPNPASQYFHVLSAGNLVIYNSNGLKIYEKQTIENEKIEVTNFTKGIYFYKMSNSEFRKLIID
ncbi:MAG: T9SS type A sorting domain-containing protein [Cytophagales bacterium]